MKYTVIVFLKYKIIIASKQIIILLLANGIMGIKNQLWKWKILNKRQLYLNMDVAFQI